MTQTASQAKIKRAAARDERRQQLIDAAKEVFAQKGYHATTVDDITRAAGVAKGTFYLYFSEKREVFYEVVRAFFQLIKDVGSSVAREVRSADEFLARAEQAALEMLRIFAANRQLARLAYRESMGLDDRLEQMIRDFYRDIAQVEADNIRRGIELGMFRPVNPLVCAYAHIGMIERVLLQSLHRDSGLPAPELVVRELLSLAYDGLRKR
ncbi:MAG TPA: helix-turn-helix domain-containing protein [Polyangia bacterium]|nr:helix-turn-helix domain-containing protein [Polyangia bacterium]